eukprot:jgi/Mesvir1/7104/Mv24246-RA.1
MKVTGGLQVSSVQQCHNALHNLTATAALAHAASSITRGDPTPAITAMPAAETESQRTKVIEPSAPTAEPTAARPGPGLQLRPRQRQPRQWDPREPGPKLHPHPRQRQARQQDKRGRWHLLLTRKTFHQHPMAKLRAYPGQLKAGLLWCLWMTMRIGMVMVRT